MKFNEKLMELRKKAGLSQEELGYKLNVTRQTVSKWELGQTTPEMDKLVEMSKIFNISVDELINESEVITNQNPIIEDQPIGNGKTKNNKMVIIIVGALIIVVVLMVIKIFTSFSSVNKETTGATNDVVDGVTEVQKNIFEKFFSIFDQANEMIENTNKKMEISEFNATIEMYNGTKLGAQTKEVLDNVITSNKKEERKITVKYKETETEDTQEIKNLKTNFDDFANFEVSFEYDAEGYINKVIIERVISQMEIEQFNSVLEMYSGTKNGLIARTTLDKIITSNKTEDRKITVKYNETELQDESEIKTIKQNIGTFDTYEITFEYDADGFINKAIIEKL